MSKYKITGLDFLGFEEKSHRLPQKNVNTVQNERNTYQSKPMIYPMSISNAIILS